VAIAGWEVNVVSLQRNDIRLDTAYDLFRHRDHSLRQQTSVEAIHDGSNPAIMKIIVNTRSDAGPIVHWHLQDPLSGSDQKNQALIQDLQRVQFYRI
jgi:hypothetical protein